MALTDKDREWATLMAVRREVIEQALSDPDLSLSPLDRENTRAIRQAVAPGSRQWLTRCGGRPGDGIGLSGGTVLACPSSPFGHV